MQFTLDSLAHVIACLQEENSYYQITHKPKILSGNKMEFPAQQNTVYFGVLALPENVNAHLFYNGDEVIKIDDLSQAYQTFTECKFYDNDGNEINGKGFFRGFIIQMQTP